MVQFIFHVFTFPICAAVALMDYNNRKGFWQNYLEISGIKADQDKAEAEDK